MARRRPDRLQQDQALRSARPRSVRRSERDYGGYGDRYDDERYEDSRYGRERDRAREYYWREREQRQETRRTAYLVIGGLCIALIALIGVLAIIGDDPSQTAQQVPQQAPQQQNSQQAPAAPGPDAASPEQVEGMRADIERQLAEIRQSINELRLQIMSWWASDQAQDSSS